MIYYSVGSFLATYWKTDLFSFFDLYQNIASDGIFKPWLDESCLTIVPRTE